MVAAKGALPWARTLLRLTGHFRCGKCDSVRPITAMFGHPPEASPVKSFGSSSEPPGSAGISVTDSPDMTDPDPATVADEAGFKRAPGGSVIPGEIALRPVTVPGDLEIPARCEALLTMPGGPDDTRVRGEVRVPWLAKLCDGRTLLATGHADGAVHLRDPSSRNSFGELWRREGQPVAGMTFDEDLVVVYGSLDVRRMEPDRGQRRTLKHGTQAGILARQRPPAHRGRLPRHGPQLPQADPARRPQRHGLAVGDVRRAPRRPLPPDPRHREVFAIAASAGFVVTASLADANLRIRQPLSNIFSLVPLESAPQWLTFTGDTLTVGLTTGPVSFSLR